MEILGEALQVGERANDSRGETLLHFTESSKGERMNENIWRRFREVLWAIGSHGGAGKLQYKCVKRLESQEGRAFNPESLEPSNLHVALCIGSS